MDAFQDELVSMDPYDRLARDRGYGAAAAARMIEQVEQHDGAIMIAEGEGQIVGFAAGEIRRRPRQERLEIVRYKNGVIAELYVSPSDRRKGVARLLVAELERFFKERGCGAIQVEVFAPNEAARAFYATLGFEERDLVLLRLLEPPARSLT